MSNLSDRDREILRVGWQCFKNTPEMNWDDFTTMSGYSTKGSATTCYSNTKKKFLANNSGAMTDRELELIAIAWKCFKEQPQVDFNKFSAIAGYKTTNSASVCFSGVKMKFFKGFGLDPPVCSGGRGGGKRKAAKADDAGGEKPKKRAKKAAPKVAIKKEQIKVEDMSDDEDNSRANRWIHGHYGAIKPAKPKVADEEIRDLSPQHAQQDPNIQNNEIADAIVQPASAPAETQDLGSDNGVDAAEDSYEKILDGAKEYLAEGTPDG